MHVTFQFKNFEPSEHLRKYARRRMEKLGRFFGKNAAVDVDVVMSVDKFRQKVEVQSSDMYASIDLVEDKIGSQIKKFISRNRDQWRKARATPAIDVFSYTEAPLPEAADDRTITDRGDEHYSPKPMSPDEAAMQLDARDYDFIVFRNAENDRINVIYRRKTGDYGLIDPAV